MRKLLGHFPGVGWWKLAENSIEYKSRVFLYIVEMLFSFRGYNFGDKK